MRTTRKAKPGPAFRCSPLVAALAMALAPQAQALTYVVTSTASSGLGSLNAAIAAANANCPADPFPRIEFNIPSGPFVIAQPVSLPEFLCSTNPYFPTVDGYTQPGATPNGAYSGFDATILIVLDGTVYGGCGLTSNDYWGYGSFLTVKGLAIRDYNGAGLCGSIRALGNRITGNYDGIQLYQGFVGDTSVAGRNVISGNTNAGVEVSYGGPAVTIINNFIGTSTGADSAGNATGVLIEATAATINDNVISGNTVTGIRFNFDSGSLITSNKIGVDVTGNSPLPNNVGIQISSSDGGPSLFSNTISGNNSYGVYIVDSEGVTLNGNRFGTDLGATSAIGNSIGVKAQCSDNIVLISNFISGNRSHGVDFDGVDGLGTININGNKIGVGGGGVSIGNGGVGLRIDSGACSQNGDDNHLFNNTIANNGDDGVALQSGFGNKLTQNLIYANGVMYGGKNININSSPSPLPNDPGDGDGGPNNQQNWPKIDSVEDDGDGGMVISYTLDSTPSTRFNIEFFSNPAPGAPAGRTFEGSRLETTNASGIATGSYRISGSANHFSLTATNAALPSPTNDTSEFSPIGSIGLEPAVTLSASMIDFGAIAVGSSSLPDSVTVSSVGSAPYRITKFDQISGCYGSGAFCYGGGFSCSTTCSVSPSQYAPGTSCSVTATFAPIFPGPQSTTVYLCDNTSATPHSITLNGNGVVPPVISIIPAQWDFGNALVGQRSAVKNFTIHNPSATPASIAAPSTTGAFTLIGSDCTTTINPNDSCHADVVFAPTQPGLTSGALLVPTDTTMEPQAMGKGARAKVSEMPSASAPLYGTGTQGSVLSMPASISVPAFTVGGPPTSKSVQITNTGNAALSFSSITTSAPFTVLHDCPLNLLPGKSCTVTVSFSSPVKGDFNGTLTVVTFAAGGSRAIPITAIAQTVSTPLIHVTPTFIGFGARMIGTQSATQSVTITNDGGAAATLSSLSVGADYLVSTTCGLTLEPAATCFAEVTFRPIGFGPRPGQFTFSSNSPGSPFVVEMLGSGCRPFTISNRGGSSSACGP